MLIKDNYNLRKAIGDLADIYDATTALLIGTILGECDAPKDYLRAKNRIVYAFVYGKTPAVGFDSPFADERIRCGLSRINKNLFPNDCKIEYPYKRQYDIDVKEVYRAININVCEYIIRWIKDSAEEFDLPDLVKKYKLAVKALRAEINRLEEVELLSETDYGCTGRSDL